MKSQTRRLIITMITICSALLAATIILLVSQWHYYQSAVSAREGSKDYSRHFFMIVSKPEDDFWSSVYSVASSVGEKNDAYVELASGDYYSHYSTPELLEIAVAAKVDGILLESDGSQDINTWIDQAGEAGIPVVTLLRDIPDSLRVCHVGISYRQLGQQYGEQIVQYMKQQREQNPSSWKKTVITVLAGVDYLSSVEHVVSPAIEKYLSENSSGIDFTVNTQGIDTLVPFKAKEFIWNLMFRQREQEQLFVCLDDACSEYVYQVLREHAQLKEIPMIAFYTGDEILAGIKTSDIICTAGVNTVAMGEKGVEALVQYLEDGVAQDSSLDTFIVDRSNAYIYIHSSEE